MEDKKEWLFMKVYDKQYKKLLIIPFVLLFIALVLIFYKYSTTGEFIEKGISLKGGTTITIPMVKGVNIEELRASLLSSFPGRDINIRELSRIGQSSGIIIEADVDPEETDELSSFLEKVERELSIKKDDYSIEIIGSSLGESFFRETIVAISIAFLFMGIVVFIYFRSFVPSIAVILSAFSDIIETLAIVNLLEIKLSTAGIAAFLMLIGYSVDTDILLSTRVLKVTEGTVFEKIKGAMRTGLMMSGTTIVAILTALIFTQSEVIRQIMIILLIGLGIDLINTWIQNAGLLRLYVERKQKPYEEKSGNDVEGEYE
ncbi:MAG: protein translocase subunit SecF [Candidatus Woesearchaeota archaeon]|jgi:preprotein translocase subunit SecF|nr:protein translocase subunit SecF [Candidatus Woesearchaeota archaeon]MDP7506481.1 protein translocase subunit SecF [Candidatus Woesearchaeota archaeon]|tara:strand:- start:224 stop:1171 length:948 start_codon:yes stop_codon:yes gene_type:complete